MKALIIVTVLAMATSAIAVPLSRQAKALALLAAMQDNAHQELDRESAVMQEDAEMEGLLRSIGKSLDPAMLRDSLRLLNDGDDGVQGKDQSNNDLLVHVQQPGSRRGHAPDRRRGHAPGRKVPNPDNQEQWRTNLRRLLGNPENNNNNNQLNDNSDSVNTIATLKRKYHKG